MKLIGVITGDLVKSREIEAREREALYAHLQSFFSRLKQESRITAYELFRGDSFQYTTTSVEESLRLALTVRTFINAFELKGKNENARGYTAIKYDARISIGMGGADFINSNSVAQSDGEAFYLSGENLDKLKGMPYRMALASTDKNFTEAMEPSILLLDALIQKWTKNQAEIVLYKLQNYKETDIAAALGITQPAVNQRTKTAQWYAIEHLLSYFYKTVKN